MDTIHVSTPTSTDPTKHGSEPETKVIHRLEKPPKAVHAVY